MSTTKSADPADNTRTQDSWNREGVMKDEIREIKHRY